MVHVESPCRGLGSRLGEPQRQCGRPGLRTLPTTRPPPPGALPRRRARSSRSSLATTQQQPTRCQRRRHTRHRAPTRTTHRRRPRRRPDHPTNTPGPTRPARALHLDDPPHPAPPRPDHPTTTQTPQKLLHPIRRRTTQRMLAIGLHPLDTGRRHRSSKSSTGSMTTPDTSWPAPPTDASPGPTS